MKDNSKEWRDAWLKGICSGDLVCFVDIAGKEDLSTVSSSSKNFVHCGNLMFDRLSGLRVSSTGEFINKDHEDFMELQYPTNIIKLRVRKATIVDHLHKVDWTSLSIETLEEIIDLVPFESIKR